MGGARHQYVASAPVHAPLRPDVALLPTFPDAPVDVADDALLLLAYVKVLIKRERAAVLRTLVEGRPPTAVDHARLQVAFGRLTRMASRP